MLIGTTSHLFLFFYWALKHFKLGQLYIVYIYFLLLALSHKAK